MENTESGNGNGNGNSEKVIRRTNVYTTIDLCSASSLDSTIIILCHNSCLNCALYIFDKAAQDQVIGVTDHELLH